MIYGTLYHFFKLSRQFLTPNPAHKFHTLLNFLIFLLSISAFNFSFSLFLSSFTHHFPSLFIFFSLFTRGVVCFSPHHTTLTYTLNAFSGLDIGSFSEWLTATLRLQLNLGLQSSQCHQPPFLLRPHSGASFVFSLLLGLEGFAPKRGSWFGV